LHEAKCKKHRIKSQCDNRWGYTGSAQIGTYVLREREHEGALWTPGWQWDGSFSLNRSGEFDMSILDVDSLTVLFSLLGCKIGSQSVQFPARGLNAKQTNWRFSRALPGLETS